MTLLWILYALLQLANLADWWTTRRGLAAGAAEANPLMRVVLRRIGIGGLLVVKVAVVSVIGLSVVLQGRWDWMAFGVALFSAAAVHNVGVTRRVLALRVPNDEPGAE